jgi:hypothetical protein
MPAKKMRVELFDSEGNRYTIAFEGLITRDKAVRLLDLVELLGGMQQSVAGSQGLDATRLPQNLSKYDKVQVVARKSLPLVWFSSREMQLAYEQEFKEPINLSTVATYLARLTDKGVLSKAGPANSLKYKLITVAPQLVAKQKEL